MKFGFIGTGAIAEAMIVGMLGPGKKAIGSRLSTVFVSERNQERSAALAKKFSSVKVIQDNQTIVDKSDWVFVSVLPDQAEPIFRELNFRQDQKVISLVAGHSVSQIQSWTIPAINVHRIIPLPPIEFALGPIPVFPANPEVEKILNCIGTAVRVTDERNFTAFSAGSAIMATYFEFAATLAKWIENQHVDGQAAVTYATTMLEALASTTTTASPAKLAEMADECLTAGGLNEQMLLEGREANWFQAIPERLDRIMTRLED